MENSLYSLNDLKSFFIGRGWGVVPDLLIENMNQWQYEELRLGYFLHFHTHNEVAEHLVSLGVIGGLLFLLYIYFIFSEASKLSFSSKLGWFLFFKIACFWFLWPGTLTLFAVCLSCFITYDNNNSKFSLFFKNSRSKNLTISSVSVFIAFFLFYGAFLTYETTKMNPLLGYNAVVQHLNSKKENDKECLSYFKDFNRGGFMLDRQLAGYSTYVFKNDNKHNLFISIRKHIPPEYFSHTNQLGFARNPRGMLAVAAR